LSKGRAVRIDQELVKALAHPVRVQILEVLQGRVASPTDISEGMEESLGVVSYHANTLAGYGCIELVRTRPRRGALEHFFRATPRSFIGHQDWRRAPRVLRGGVTDAALGTFLDHVAAAVDAGTIDAREETTLSWMPITVDDTGWKELAAVMAEAGRLAAAIHAKSVKRLGTEEGTPAIVGLAGFEAGRLEGSAGPG
jgi:DNA-binding transcriptional ArsR family regulator